MTTPADDRAVEGAFEAALAGRAAPGGSAALTAFTDAVRAEATAPGRPNAALAELLATGLLTDPPRTTVGRRTPASRKRRRMILSSLVAKFAAAGAVAKASMAGGAVAALALTGAVTTDVLPLPGDDVVASSDASAPDPAEDAVTVDDATDDLTADIGEPEDDVQGTDEQQTDGETTDPEQAPEVTAETWAQGPQGSQTFSQWVSAGARAGIVRGEVVSCFAQVRNGHKDPEDCAPVAAAPLEQQPAPAAQGDATTDVTDTAPAVAAPAPTATSSGSGHGNSGTSGNSGGNGSSGHGNSGPGDRGH